ncbi:MAG: (d)CMP kinase [Candidatus Omnitrophica bacterium]|nr:(d)CMP kinase [Candidatus Omnitrophota bacterium]MCM8831354.1 (d)CMP kinase [Candidatus Omnitrophota bacterium]
MIVAIDGPAGSGKTTVAKLLSKTLGFCYLDTGAMYRALTLKALWENCNLEDVNALVNLAKNLSLELKKEKIYLDGKDVTFQIRTPNIDKNISKVVSYPEVRSIMVELQRSIIKGKNYVVEGRDITTVVCPDAEFKFYLDADLNVRAKRRAKDFEEKKIKIEIEEVLQELKRRDEADKNRKVGALKISKDAIYIDTTNLSIDEVIKTMLNYIKK